jgi:hypothetical protein
MRRAAARALVHLLAAAVVVTGCSTTGETRRAAATPQPSRANAQPAPQTAVGHWRITGNGSGSIAGFASATSVQPGDPLNVYVSTTARTFSLQVFRMGWYGGREGTLVETLADLPGAAQRPAQLVGPRHMVVAPWRPSAALDTSALQPGDYLLRLVATGGGKSFVPLTVRAPSAAGTVVLVSPVTTWQAYNTWGCCDLYSGADGAFATRSRAVSFDRPYAAENGAAEFLTRELPVLAEAERLRLPLDYVTDVDLDRDPHLLDGARAVISMGHDEYWSPAMRRAVTAARDAGVNVAFLGANAVFRRIRFEDSRLGPDRVEVDYKIADEDPELGHHNATVTSDWPDPPDPQPENVLTGESYGCFSQVRMPATISDPSSPLFRGTGVRNGTKLPGLLGPETDRVFPDMPGPAAVDLLMHSPFPCPLGLASYADTTYYTTASGSGVFDSGTESWVCAVGGVCADPTTARVVRRVTDNLLELFATGPAARVAPVHDNVRDIYAKH